MRSTPPEPAPDTICRSPDSVALATFQPSPISPTRCASGTTASDEEHLVEVDVAADVAQRPHVDAGLVQVDEEVRDAGALRRVGIGAREQHAEVGAVRPRGPHLLPVDDPAVAVALGACRERREVGARARFAEQLAPHLFVAHDRREVAQPLLLGAVREQRGRREVEPERVEAAEVERRELLLDAARHRRRADRGRRTPPARSARRVPTPRTPGTTPRTRRACGRSRTAAGPPRRPASTHAGGTLASIHARTAATASASLARASIASCVASLTQRP